MSELRIETAVTETLRAMAAAAKLDAHMASIQLQIERDPTRRELAVAAEQAVAEAVRACETELELPPGARLTGIEEGCLVYSVPGPVEK